MQIYVTVQCMFLCYPCFYLRRNHLGTNLEGAMSHDSTKLLVVVIIHDSLAYWL